tara:strand:+ start:60 stop:395 length:336 start_codon:yes stop_codon:yes gene_type:complete
MDVPEDKFVPVELRPGQSSVHHPWAVRGSGHNTSNKLRVSFAIQSYIGADVEQHLGRIFVQLDRVRDDYGYHYLFLIASRIMVDDEAATLHAANQQVRGAIYDDAEKIGKY